MNARAYLLGTLDLEQRLAVEREMLVNEESYELLLAAEDDLIDEYVKNELAGDERARFARLFLQDPTRRERVYQAATLVTAAAPARPSRRAWLWGSASALATCALLGVALLTTGQPRSVEITLAAPARSAEVAELVVPAGTQTIRVTPTLPVGTEPVQVRFRCRQLGGGVVEGTARGPTWQVDAARLPAGRYELEVADAQDGRPLAFYRFTVRR